MSIFSKKGVTVAAMVLAATVSAPAVAQDTGNVEAYAGLIGGYDNVRLSAAGVSDGDSGLLYGLVLGVQNNINNNAVIGLEAEISDSTVSETETDVFTAGDKLKLSAGRDLFIGMRAGAFVAPNVLLYAKGGYVNAKATLAYTGNTGAIVKDSDTVGGYRLGAGVEVGKGLVRFRGEYRYSDYGKYYLPGATVATKRHQFVAGLIAAF